VSAPTPSQEVATFLAERGHGTAREIVDATGGDLHTIASRLSKGAAYGTLMRRQEGRGYRYWPIDAPEPAEGARHVRVVPAALRSETVVLLAIAREPGSTVGEIADATLLDAAEVDAALALLEACDAVERQGTCWRVQS
jgi:hypothetical protein